MLARQQARALRGGPQLVFDLGFGIWTFRLRLRQFELSRVLCNPRCVVEVALSLMLPLTSGRDVVFLPPRADADDAYLLLDLR